MITPSSLTFLTTYRCTAACAECCFQSSPGNPGRMLELAECTGIIDQAAESFSSLRLVVFSGGECFLMGEALMRAIAHAVGKGFLTRCVTNGYWGKERSHAARMAGALAVAGLKEINFSTGDDHQCFVPVQAVVHAALECARRGIRTLIVVEGHSRSKFRLQDLLRHPDLLEFIGREPGAANLQLLQNVWIPFNTDRVIEHPDILELRHRAREGGETGCNQILHNLVVTPDLQLASCCGLTLEYIDELKLGRIQDNLRGLFEAQTDDFIKLWLYTDGPNKILEFVREKNPSIATGRHVVHPCQACALMFNDGEVKREISRRYMEVFDDVMFKFHLKQERLSSTEYYQKESHGVPA